jgi:deoxyribose-phosphate aldolase
MPLTVQELARMIDHSLVSPTLTDEMLRAGCSLARRYGVATVCVVPHWVSNAAAELQNSGVGVCTVAGFPHGSSHTDLKVAEAVRGVRDGADEIDAVVNVSRVLSDDWTYVRDELKSLNDAVTASGAILKVIFENDFLEHRHIAKLAAIATDVEIAFIKTSTGYGFTKRKNGMYRYDGATEKHLRLMREHAGPGVQIKAAGGVRTLPHLVRVWQLGVTRVGATATAAILDEARRLQGAGVNLDGVAESLPGTGQY